MITTYIADDEVWIVLGLKKLLQKSGYEVSVVGTANNGLTAREEIAALKPDLAFTDIRMPGLTGLELLQSISEISPQTQVVIISGYAEFNYALEAVKYHAFDYLLKPIKAEELARVLEKYRSVQAPGEEKAQSAAPEYDTTIDRVITEIRGHYTEDISLTSLAAKYNLSTGRLSTMIKEALQMNYSDYIASLRIQRAKELLQNEALSIQEIAEMVGYNDYFYFTKVFKKVQGISPSKYRKSL